MLKFFIFLNLRGSSLLYARDSLVLFLIGCGFLSIRRKHIWSITMLKDELSVGVLGALEL